MHLHSLPRLGTAVCSDATFTMACMANEVVVISGAFWGRATIAACPNSQVYTPSDLQCGVATKASFVAAVQGRCNGRTNCSVTADNSLTGSDPCFGAYPGHQLLSVGLDRVINSVSSTFYLPAARHQFALRSFRPSSWPPLRTYDAAATDADVMQALSNI